MASRMFEAETEDSEAYMEAEGDIPNPIEPTGNEEVNESVKSSVDEDRLSFKSDFHSLTIGGRRVYLDMQSKQMRCKPRISDNPSVNLYGFWSKNDIRNAAAFEYRVIKSGMSQKKEQKIQKLIFTISGPHFEIHQEVGSRSSQIALYIEIEDKKYYFVTNQSDDRGIIYASANVSAPQEKYIWKWHHKTYTVQVTEKPF